MKALIETVQKNNVRFKYNTFIIDNLIFRLHYRFTMLLMIVMVLLITSQELIGEHIKCMGAKGVEEKMMNRYCYFTTTFTVVKYMNETMLSKGEILYPGVGVHGQENEEEIKHHAYYQWVPFVLFGQALLFYMPHFFWKMEEKHTMKKLAEVLANAPFTSEQIKKELTVGKSKIPTKETVDKHIKELGKYFVETLQYNYYWGVWLMFYEVMNLGNVILNIFITNGFLGGQFLSLGSNVVREGLDSDVDPLDVVFPKMTKCTFYKFGPSGSLQPIDAICVMALNIINEKAYVVLWFWFMFLLAMTILNLLWRVISYCLYSNSGFNKTVFSYAGSGRFDPKQLQTVTKKCTYLDWIFLVYLAKNMKYLVFKQFLDVLADEVENSKVQNRNLTKKRFQVTKSLMDKDHDDDNDKHEKKKLEAFYVEKEKENEKLLEEEDYDTTDYSDLIKALTKMQNKDEKPLRDDDGKTAYASVIKELEARMEQMKKENDKKK